MNSINDTRHEGVHINRNRYKTIRINIKNKTKKTLYVPLFSKDNVNDNNDYTIDCNQIVLCNKSIIGKIDYNKVVSDFIVNPQAIRIISQVNSRRYSLTYKNLLGETYDMLKKLAFLKELLIYEPYKTNIVVKINPKESFDIDFKIYTFNTLKITEI